MQVFSTICKGLSCTLKIKHTFSWRYYIRFSSSIQLENVLNKFKLEHNPTNHELVSYLKNISEVLRTYSLSNLNNPSIMTCLPNVNINSCKETLVDLSHYIRSIKTKDDRSKTACLLLLMYVKHNNSNDNIFDLISTFKENNVFVDSDIFIPIILWTLRKKEFDKSGRFLMEMASIIELPFKDNDFHNIIDTCVALRAEEYDDATRFAEECFQVISDFGRNDLSKSLLDSIFSWFKTDPKVTWNISRENINPKGRCKKCFNYLETFYISPHRLKNLEANLLINLEPTLKKDLKKWKSFTQYLDLYGPFDVVIDPLNLGYADDGFNPKLLKSKVDKFLRQSKNILIVCAGPLRGNIKKDVRKLLLYLNYRCSLFFLPHKYPDDDYLLYTLVHHKFNIKMVSNDFFRDKVYQLDKECSADFNRWQKANQYHFYRDAGPDGSPVLFPIYKYHTGMQRHEHGWHLPVQRLWFCISRKN